MATVTAKPGVSPSSAQAAANRVSQDIAGASNPNWSPFGGGGSGGGSSAVQNAQSYLDKYIAMIKSNVAENNAWSAEQAKINRDWQERMSNTAHQREVADLKKAGLNPVLSAMNGNGAATTSGATASTDTSANSAITSLLGAMISSLTQQENARLSAQTNLAVAEKYNAMSKYTAELGANTQLSLGRLSAQTALSTANIQATTNRWIAQLQASTSLTTAQINKAAQIASAQLHAAATRYAADKGYLSAQNVANINAAVNRELNAANIQAKFDFAEAYPTSDQVLGGVSDEAVQGIYGVTNSAKEYLNSLRTPVKGDSIFDNFLGALIRSGESISNIFFK